MDHTIDSALGALAGIRVFFGHQSVGENILDGVRDLTRPAAHEWPIVLHGEPPPPSGGYLLHARVGRNEHPLTKCDEFRRILDEGLRGAVDIALLKFCYIDIDERTDVDALAASYQSLLEDLGRRHPSVAFVPVTAPLRHSPKGAGVWLRERLGRPNRSKLANAKRHRFNEHLRRAWQDAPLFDLAASEATRPDGRRESFTAGGQRYDNMVGAYTDDGGHLNEVGRRVAATHLIQSLAAAARSRAGRTPAVSRT